MRRMMGLIVVLGLLCGAAGAEEAAPAIVPPKLPLPVFPDRFVVVSDFGTRADGKSNDTAAINRAIEACSAAGGGTVFFPAGRYLAASIHLRSHVQLRLDAQAAIVGAKEGYDPPEPNAFDQYQDFGHSHFHNALLWGENLEDVAITGGKINGGGIISGNPRSGGGDKVIAIRSGKGLYFHDIVHESGGHFVYLLNDCQSVTLEKITIERSRDAVDLMGCRDVNVHDCRFTGCGDDTLGIKSDYALGRKIRSEHIYAWDCYFETGCNGVQFGSETAGDFSNIKAWNIRIGRAAKAGIGITCNDGGIIDGVEFRNFEMRKVTNPIFMVITDRLRTGEKGARPGAIRNVVISNVKVSQMVASSRGQSNACTLAGMPDHPIENVTLENIRITYEGGGRREEADINPPYTKQYQPRTLGVRPAYGLYARHVRGLTLRNVAFGYEKPDLRPAVSLLDVDGVVFDGFDAQTGDGIELMRLANVRELRIARTRGVRDQQLGAIDKMRLGR